MSLKQHVWDHLPEFALALHQQLVEDEARWGDTWKQRTREGQEARISERIDQYFIEWRRDGTPVPWLKIAGLAMIAWIRDTESE